MRTRKQGKRRGGVTLLLIIGLLVISFRPSVRGSKFAEEDVDQAIVAVAEARLDVRV